VIAHAIPPLNGDAQIADRPKLPLTDMQIQRAILPQALSQLGSLLLAELVGIPTAPVRPERAQSILLIALHPLPHAALPAGNQVHDFPHADPAPVQTHRLQPLQFVNVSRLLLRLPEFSHFCRIQFKLSLCHPFILHPLMSF